MKFGSISTRSIYWVKQLCFNLNPLKAVESEDYSNGGKQNINIWIQWHFEFRVFIAGINAYYHFGIDMYRYFIYIIKPLKVIRL